MALKYAQIKTVEELGTLGLGAGILCTGFVPDTGVVTGAFGVTTGGITFNSNPTYEDWAADIDQAPNNMKEFKRLTAMDPTLSGTFLSLKNSNILSLLNKAAADADGGFTPPAPQSGYEDGLNFADVVWWVGDTTDGGSVAIKMMNVLNQSGFRINSSKDNKMQFTFEYHAHYTLPGTGELAAPFEVYLTAGT